MRPPQRAKRARKSARGGVGDGSRRPHPPHGERAAPSQVGGNGTGPPPPPSKPNGAWYRGRTRTGARTACTGPSSAQHRDRARCARHTKPGMGGGGADAARARAHTHTKGTPGNPEGQPDRALETHRPHGTAYQRARIRDTQTGRPATHSTGNMGREGGKGEHTTPGTGPNPPEPAASAAHTRPGHCTCQGSSGALRHAPAPRLGSLRASPRGSHWRQASSTGQAAPAPRGTTHKGGDTVGKHPQPRLRSDALTGEWRNGEAEEGRGSEPCEPGGLRHQTGCAS